MDRIMPNDLENAKLKKSVGGYAPEAVDALLKRAAETICSLIDETDSLKAKVATQQQELGRYHSEESLLKEALVLAQRSADETRALAHREADLVREEARQAAIAERLEAQRTLDSLRWDIERLRADRAHFAGEFRALLDRFRREADTEPIMLTVVEARPGELQAGA